VPVRVIIDSPQKNSSIIYASGYTCLDNVITIDIDGDVTGFFPATEYERAKKISKCNTVINLSEQLENLSLKKEFIPIKAAVVLQFLLKNNQKKIQVPESFPLYEADFLRENGIEIVVLQEPFYPERTTKNETEIAYIKENSVKNCEVMEAVRTIIASSNVSDNNRLYYQGEPLTSEFIQSFILKLFLDKGLVSDAVIVAIGNQGCDPHESGYGFIKAMDSIIVDIFPKSRYNNYYTDMTRTFCKWKATDDLKNIYEVVKNAQQFCLNSLSAGVIGKELHAKVVEYIEHSGYKSGMIHGVLQGFFHGTGHGVGLDCHEGPYISRNGRKIEKNSIVTVEPGLYYLNKGAVRIEDIVLVKDGGIENLTDYPKELVVE